MCQLSKSLVASCSRQTLWPLKVGSCHAQLSLQLQQLVQWQLREVELRDVVFVLTPGDWLHLQHTKVDPICITLQSMLHNAFHIFALFTLITGHFCVSQAAFPSHAKPQNTRAFCLPKSVTIIAPGSMLEPHAATSASVISCMLLPAGITDPFADCTAPCVTFLESPVSLNMSPGLARALKLSQLITAGPEAGLSADCSVCNACRHENLVATSGAFFELADSALTSRKKSYICTKGTVAS